MTQPSNPHNFQANEIHTDNEERKIKTEYKSFLLSKQKQEITLPFKKKRLHSFFKNFYFCNKIWIEYLLKNLES